MSDSISTVLLEKLDRLRVELAELAFDLECKGRVEAADVVMTISARVTEICEVDSIVE